MSLASTSASRSAVDGDSCCCCCGRYLAATVGGKSDSVLLLLLLDTITVVGTQPIVVDVVSVAVVVVVGSESETGENGIAFKFRRVIAMGGDNRSAPRFVCARIAPITGCNNRVNTYLLTYHDFATTYNTRYDGAVSDNNLLSRPSSLSIHGRVQGTWGERWGGESRLGGGHRSTNHIRNMGDD